MNKDGKWNIEPSQGFIEPESETDLVFTLYLIDANTYTNKAVIELENAKDIVSIISVHFNQHKLNSDVLNTNTKFITTYMYSYSTIKGNYVVY